MAVEEALRGDRHLLGILAVRRHPGLADRQPSVRGIADADEAKPLWLPRARSAPTTRVRPASTAPDDRDCRTSWARRPRWCRRPPPSANETRHARLASARGPAASARHSSRRRWDSPAISRSAMVGEAASVASVSDEPDRGDMKQRDRLNAQRRNRDQRQRRQKEQRDSPIGLHIDRENQAAERRSDRDHDLDDPDVERLRKIHARVGAARPWLREQREGCRTRSPTIAASRPARSPPAPPGAASSARLWPI